MALPILDGNQSATTLSTILSSGQHITAHTVVSFGTQAITDIGGAISGSTVCVGNLGLLQSTVATEGLSASGSFIKIGGHTGTSTTGNIVHVSAVGALRVDGSVYTQPVSIASVTIGNTVTIAGTVTANPTGTQTIAGTVTAGNLPIYIETDTIVDGNVVGTLVFDVNGKNAFGTNGVTVGSIPSLPAGTNRIGVVTIGGGTVTIGAGAAQIGSVTVGNSVTIASLPSLVAGTAQIGSVTASISNSVTIASFVTSVTARLINPAGTSVTYAEVGTAGSPSIDVLSVQGVTSGTAIPISISSVTIGSLPAISGTVTANSSNGSLTTRFGSVTTANTAFATSAVTNANRKYLLIQNVTTASNVITVGIGFTPTTTQGIQLSSGAGLTFEGSYIPTGAVNLLSSVTASCFTILEA